MYTPADIEGSAYLEEARALGRSLKENNPLKNLGRQLSTGRSSSSRFPADFKGLLNLIQGKPF